MTDPSTVESPRAAERLAWLVRNLRTWIFALALLLIASAVAVTYSLGLFTSTSANPGNTATSGSMTQVNSRADQAVLGATDMVPGTEATGGVTIQNVGDASEEFTLSGTDAVDAPGPNGGKLATVLVLSIVDTGTGTSLYAGRLDRFTSVSLGTWAPGEERTYEFLVDFPDDPVLPISPTDRDNRFQGSSTSITFDFDAVQSH